ncbi:MAG: tol-pal system protein YbgF [Acidobacteria bacterium]|nr:tol-pal system protein YbgF [Acidobacteriota bacterium]
MRRTLCVAVSLAFALSGPVHAQSTKDRLIRLQATVDTLQTQMTLMQRSFDERMGVMRSLAEQSTDNLNKVTETVTRLERSLSEQAGQTGDKVEQVSVQVQALQDSLDELKARTARLAQQLEEMKALQADIGAVTPANPPADAPPADTLYKNALTDYNAGRHDLAMQQFQDYLKYYPNTELAGNAHFYVADLEYRQKNFQAAVAGYDKVIEQYPEGNKVRAAMLKKGFALLELGQRDQGISALRTLASRYPRSSEANSARERLRKLGVAAR